MGSFGGIIFLVLIVGGWVIKAIAAANENKSKGGGRPDRSGQPRVDYEELAARRRRELQQQAQQRRAQQGRGPSAQAQVPQRDPATMSMAERIEMARQRASGQGGGQAGRSQVDQQAEALRRAQQEAQQHADAQARAERARREQAARQHQQQQRQQQQHRRRVQQQSQPPPGRAATQRAAAASQRDLSQVSEDAVRKHDQSHERVLSKKSARAAKLQESKRRQKRSGSGSDLLDFSKLNRKSLRQAVVLKEILDVPVALRDTPKY